MTRARSTATPPLKATPLLPALLLPALLLPAALASADGDTTTAATTTAATTTAATTTAAATTAAAAPDDDPARQRRDAPFTASDLVDDWLLEPIAFTPAEPLRYRDDAFGDGADRVVSVSADRLRQQGVRTVGEALRFLAPGSGQQGAIRAPLVIDGLTGDQVVILINGQPAAGFQSTRQGPRVPLDTLPVDPSFIERIDVLRGMGPPGSCTDGGVIINIITRAPEPGARLSLALGSEVAAQGLTSWDARGAAQLTGPNGVSVLVRGGALVRNAIDINGDGVLDTRDELIHDVGVELTWRDRDRHELLLLAELAGEDAESPGNPRAPLVDATSINRSRFLLSGDHRLSDTLVLRHRNQVDTLDYTFSKLVRESGVSNLRAATTQVRTRSSLGLELTGARHTLSLETCAETLGVARTGETGDVPRTSDAAFCLGVHERWRPIEALELQGRALAGYHTEFGRRLLGELALAWTPADPLTLRAELSHTDRLPSLEERYLYFDHREVGYAIEGNPDLAPVRTTSGRLGATLRDAPRGLALELSAFVHRQRDLIDVALVAPASPPDRPVALYSYINIANARTAGLDVIGRAHRMPGGLRLDAHYTWLPLAVDLADNTRLPLRSMHAATIQLSGTWLDDRLTAWATIGATSALSAPDGEPDPPPDRVTAIWNVGAGWAVRDVGTIRLEGRNLLNVTDPRWGPAPGVHLRASLELNLARAPQEAQP